MQDVVPAVEKICGLCGHKTSEASDFCPEDGTLLKVSTQASLIGTTLSNRYKILSVIGSGGMGAVYKAQHLLLDRIVAVKVLHTYSGSDESDRIKRFHQEGKLISALRHPNIVTALDFNSDNGLAYLVMDYIEGQSLQDAIADEGPMSWRRCVRLMREVCDAVAYAHSQGVIHRDIKPSNIMITQGHDGSEHVKLLDFGVAKILHPTDTKMSPHTRTGIVFGSPLYMSPEQCIGQPPDTRSDIYSIGCVMYEALSGRTPIEGDNSLEILHKQITDIPPRFGALEENLQVPFSVESVVTKMLLKNENERYQTVSDVIKDLDEAVHNPRFSATKPELVVVDNSWRRKVAATAIFILVASTIFVSVRAHRLHVKELKFTHPDPVIGSGTLINKASVLAKAVFLSQKAQALLRQNKFEEAEQMFNAAVQLRKSASVQDSDLAQDLTKLSLAHYKQGEDKEASECAEEAILTHKHHGGVSLAMADSLNCLGISMLEAQRYRAAEATFNEALQIRKKYNDTKSSSLADTLYGLAIASKHLNKHGQAKQFTTEANAIRKTAVEDVNELFDEAEAGINR